MARSPVAVTSVACAACGAIIRADRPTCLRCNAPLRAAEPAPSPGVSARRPAWASWQNGALAAGCIVLTAVAATYDRQPTTAPAVTAAAQVPADTGTAATARRPSATRDATAPASAQVVVDALQNGEVAYNSGDLAGALTQYQHALEANPSDPVALNNVGQTLIRLDRGSEAIPYFDRAIQVAPDNWAPHFNRARAFAQLKQWVLAIDGYRQASTLFPDDYVTVFNLAKALQANGNVAEALQSYERAIALAPSQADFRLSYGLALESARRPAEALAAYRTFLELDPAAADADKVKARIAQLEGVKS